MRLLTVTLFSVVFFQLSFGQNNKSKAKGKAQLAIKSMEQGDTEQARKLLKESQKLDPNNINYPYEIAYSLVLDKNYPKAIKVLKKLEKHEDVNPMVYQMLGNSYDYNKQTEKAIETYERGLKKFPNAGQLYLERGNIELTKEKYNEAIMYYERGIEKDPTFPSNYYWASKLYLNSTEEVWGMLYGEIFVNLEPLTKRSIEISQLMYKVYKSEIVFKDSSVVVSFSQNASISLDALKDPDNFKLPFGMGCYEMCMSISVVGEKEINLESLNRIRSNFIDQYFGNTTNTNNYPNILFDWQKKIKESGHIEAYNYYLLMMGEQEEFKEWKKDNEEKFNDFLDWYKKNPLPIDDKNKFYRTQY